MAKKPVTIADLKAALLVDIQKQHDLELRRLDKAKTTSRLDIIALEFGSRATHKLFDRYYDEEDSK